MRNGLYELVIAPPDYPGKRYRGRYCYEHHLVWWQNTGEVPGPKELIHHKNEHKRDNSFSNLEKITKAEHDKHHSDKRHEECLVVVVCTNCGKSFRIAGGKYRTRIKGSKSGNLFCSYRCQGVCQPNVCMKIRSGIRQ